jgi:hypothetical protein
VELISGYDRLSSVTAQHCITYPIAEAKWTPINEENEEEMSQPYTGWATKMYPAFRLHLHLTTVLISVFMLATYPDYFNEKVARVRSIA